MQELAEQLDGDTQRLLSRWEGKPEQVIEDVFRVRDLESKEVTNLELTDYQKQFVRAYWYGDASTLNVLKGRRTGYSFIACATILLDAMTTPHGFFAITAPSKSQAKDRIDDVYDLISWSPLEFDLETDNRDEIELPNGATIMAFSGNPDTSRGADSADTLYIDEMAFLEDQHESMNAFSPFTALGDATTVEISTPRHTNDLFMQDQERGSPTGENGIISIYQPAFRNPEKIDPHTSLLEQDVEPVMPYLDLEEAEKDRARDPKGFKQEYLCKPVEDQYRFFDEDTVELAAERGATDDYVWGPTVGPQRDGKVVMGVDIAGGGKDDTAIVIVEHVGKMRFERYHEVVTDELLAKVDIEPAKARNPSALAKRIHQLYRVHDVDKVVTDATNIGEGFDSEIRETIGRGVSSFNFSDSESVAEMMGDLNYGFHNGQVVFRNEDDRLKGQILAIVKEQPRKGSTPKFSGKDRAPNGKDDLAIAFALAAYPPNVKTDGADTLKQQDEDDIEPADVVPSTGPDVSVSAVNDTQSSGFQGVLHKKTGQRSGSGSDGYSRRHRRRGRR